MDCQSSSQSSIVIVSIYSVDGIQGCDRLTNRDRNLSGQVFFFK
ncbi:MAG: hypothetical protein WBM44_20725 [Waterburya sp.]